MKLTNMKMPAKKAKELNAPATVGADAPRYPYGLCLSLENDALDKLGLKSLPKIGAVVEVIAKAKVQRVSETDTTEGGKRRSLELQITDLGFEMPKPNSEDIMYPEMKASKMGKSK